MLGYEYSFSPMVTSIISIVLFAAATHISTKGASWLGKIAEIVAYGCICPVRHLCAGALMALSGDHVPAQPITLEAMTPHRQLGDARHHVLDLPGGGRCRDSGGLPQ